MELKGVRFGLLTAVKRTTKGTRVAWECACDCGNRTVAAQLELRNGDTKSCGCLRIAATSAKNTTHGMTHTRAYAKWKGMWARVRNAHLKENHCYIGVAVCKRWEKFENFYADMGELPEGYSLDRIDNKKGYSKSNCRWVPLEEQSRNTRRLRLHKGVHISEAARRVGLNPDVVLDRINKLGWDIDRALATPLRVTKGNKCEKH